MEHVIGLLDQAVERLEALVRVQIEAPTKTLSKQPGARAEWMLVRSRADALETFVGSIGYWRERLVDFGESHELPEDARVHVNLVTEQLLAKACERLRAAGQTLDT